MQTIFEKSIPGRSSFGLKDLDFTDIECPKLTDGLAKTKMPNLPDVSEIDVVRHFSNLSQRNAGIDQIFYPLGSCTMKYNPRLHEQVAANPAFKNAHPSLPANLVQGNLHIIYESERMLGEVCGMDGFTLQSAAGAHGELTGIMLMKAYHRDHPGEQKRSKILIPDAAHGTNPASAALCGYDIITIRSNDQGEVDLDHLQENLDDSVAGLMLTNPNTLGLFDRHILKISKMVHDVGGLLYYDGANLNAIMGKCRPGDMGFDIVHVNLHKTFSTPHGGGGPGAGPVGVKERLVKYLPQPRVIKENDVYAVQANEDLSIGRLMTFYGNFLVVLRAYVYMSLLGADGLKEVSETAVLNANYMMHFLKDDFALPYERVCMHEFVLSSKWQQKQGVHTKHIAKRLIDKGYHPPTTYFPLIVDEALMFEPTETENKETLDQFIADLKDIAREVETNPDIVLQAPHTTPVRQLDEVTAARKPILRWSPTE